MQEWRCGLGGSQTFPWYLRARPLRSGLAAASGAFVAALLGCAPLPTQPQPMPRPASPATAQPLPASAEVSQVKRPTRPLLGAATQLPDLPQAAGPAVPDPEPGWTLVWADEFDGAGCPDPANWRHETGFVRNRELQWYQPENAFCKDGVLVIEARRETVDNPLFVEGSRDWQTNRKTATYTSASIETRGLHAWQYGRIEVRIRIDTRAGLWPAIWTLGVDGLWPARGEIDIMESFGGKLMAGLHWKGGKRRSDMKSVRGDSLWAKAFHVWRMDWSPEKIDISLDGAPVATFTIREVANKDGSRPFHQPHYLKLNLAISGGASGNPGRTVFPARMEVDHVRVYRPESPAD